MFEISSIYLHCNIFQVKAKFDFEIKCVIFEIIPLLNMTRALTSISSDEMDKTAFVDMKLYLVMKSGRR